ncbi:PTS system mannose/fructose/sorbose family transporter subunit IID [Paratissierella segnis]|jgi:mannose/fructose/N-acetylgalactosamine-specific phosphotransferase system component IID|uniref:PTS system mannose/fructose/sorbose family transporter subunit IID n=1 Tax=Paratissierella segnis TaxID=2763679 RepID=A0A926EXE5_9FIRM|nr:PTS system mannose/fructose/sorbose family transporter subunit IID [Paratissierella segnis]MBC8588010.1 PTS system mannose/fructose/sorbose family transporter subunit IID [Paratissierella segnis]
METKVKKTTKERLTKKELWAIFRRCFLVRAHNDFEKFHAGGFINALVPVFDKYYPNTEDKAKAMMRHSELFLTHPQLEAWTVGIAASMEERLAIDGDIDQDSIQSVKTALMGPIAALGDSLINGTARPLLAGIACSLAIQGSTIGIWLFVIIMGSISVINRYTGVFIGYKKGSEFISDIHESGIIYRLTDLASVAAYTIIGGFIPGVVSFSLPFTYEVGGEVISVQDNLNALIPGLLPLCLTLLMFFFIKKKKINPLILMFTVLAIGVVGHYVGIL